MNKIKWLAAASTALAGAGIAFAGNASADGLTFIQSLNDNGITVYDAQAAVSNGLAICGQLDHANGTEVVEWVFVNTSWSDVPSRQVAAVWVLSAVNELCPWHDHRGEINA
jgi:hypothetical protein